jgi:DNA-binding XRE family transcriptional regulator
MTVVPDYNRLNVWRSGNEPASSSGPTHVFVSGGKLTMHGIKVHAARLRAIRVSHGLTQPQLALRAGIAERTVRNAEAGKGIRASFVEYLAIALRVTVDELVGKRDDLSSFSLSAAQFHTLVDHPGKPVELIDQMSRKRFVLMPAEYFDRIKVVLMIVLFLGVALDADDIFSAQDAALTVANEDDPKAKLYCRICLERGVSLTWRDAVAICVVSSVKTSTSLRKPSNTPWYFDSMKWIESRAGRRRISAVCGTVDSGRAIVSRWFVDLCHALTSFETHCPGPSPL